MNFMDAKVKVDGQKVILTVGDHKLDVPADNKGATAYLLGDSQDGNWHGVFNDAAAPADGTTTAPGDDTAATTTAKADDNKTTTTAKASDKKNSSTTATKTGDAGVGVVVAGLTLAGAAAFIARKKH
jgi:LPXTG-motif cell wall-anchored protein